MSLLTITLASEKSAQKLRSVIPGIYNMVAKNAINFARCIGPYLQILDVMKLRGKSWLMNIQLHQNTETTLLI